VGKLVGKDLGVDGKVSIGKLVGKDLEINIPEETSSKIPSVPCLPLEQITAFQLVKDLSKMLDKPAPRTWLGKFLSVRRLELDNERIGQISDYIERVRVINQSITNMQAELFLQPAVLQRIIDGDAIGAERLAELQFAEHRNAVAKHEDEMKARQIQLEAGSLANLKTRAEINAMEAKTKAEHAKADLIKYVVENIDLKNMPQILQTFVVQSIINPQGGGNIPDLELQNELKEFVKREASAKARITEASAVNEESKAVVSDITARKTKKQVEDSFK
jgi:hypothetical protein